MTVELTAGERAMLMHHIGAWKWEAQGLAAAEESFMATVELIVAARVADGAPTAARLAEAWDQGYTSGHSNAMRRMSDEPNAPTTPNPYRAAVSS